MVSKLSEIRSVLFIPDLDPDFLPIPDTGCRGQKAPDPRSGSASLLKAKEAGVQDTNSGYLVLMKHGVCDVPLWAGETKFVKPTAETTISLSQIEVKSRGKERHFFAFLLTNRGEIK
jgi:hypothetical protein